MVDISRHDVAELLSALVAIPSINPAFRREGQPPDWFGEAPLARFVADWLAAAGLETRFDEVEPGRPNLIAELRGGGPGKTMVWEGHLDTVQVDGMTDPFTARIDGSRLYGRGAVDDKGCLAMFMLALSALKRSGRPHRAVTFLAAVDEEVTFRGIVHHVRSHPAYDLGVAGEPTGLQVIRACKGVVRWHLDVAGRGAHSSKPGEGIDAIAAAAELLAHLRAHAAGAPAQPSAAWRTDADLHHDRRGRGAEHRPCPCAPDLRFPHLAGSDRHEARQENRRRRRRIRAPARRGSRFSMQPPFVDSVSMEVAEDAEIVRRLVQALESHGLPGTVAGVPFGSDASKLTRAGSPTVIFGPGHIEQAHAVDEFVDLDDVARAAAVLVTLAQSA